MKWWGDYDLEFERWARWQIGPLTLFVQSRRHEWIFAWQSVGDPLADTLSIEIPSSAVPDPHDSTVSRYAVGDIRSRLALRPRLADRPVIVRPDFPLFLLTGQKAVLFVSTVVWIATSLDVGADESCTLLEIPARRPSDTWFGADTLEGELCYASRTNARTELDLVGRRPHRAVTPIEIQNHGAVTLPIDQLRVPIPALSLHHDRDNRLWTDTVSFVHEEGEREASLTVSESSAYLPEGTSLLAPPRELVEAGTIVDAFSRFLG